MAFDEQKAEKLSDPVPFLHSKFLLCSNMQFVRPFHSPGRSVNHPSRLPGRTRDERFKHFIPSQRAIPWTNF